jgi:hypothetical protein
MVSISLRGPVKEDQYEVTGSLVILENPSVTSPGAKISDNMDRLSKIKVAKSII